MNGVEVLNTITGNGLNVAFVVVASVLLIFSIILLIFNDSEVMSIVGVLLAIVFLVVAVQRKTQYEVTISDDVSFKEFNEKYEVIEQDGDIFTVEMRENDD